MASSTPRSSGQVLFPGSGSTLRGGGSLMSRSRGGSGGGSRNLQCLSMIFFALTCCSFWMTIINFQAAMYDDTSNKPNLSEKRQLVNNRIAETIKKTNIGSLGPSKSSRTNLRYYDSLFYTTLPNLNVLPPVHKLYAMSYAV